MASPCHLTLSATSTIQSPSTPQIGKSKLAPGICPGLLAAIILIHTSEVSR